MKRSIAIMLTIIFTSALLIIMLSIYKTGVEALNATADVNSGNYGKDIAALGTLGDFFGGITNPIIGGLGSIALIITISLQINQNKQNTRQSFESSIFNLINLHNNIIDNLSFNESKSRICFSDFLEEFSEPLRKMTRSKTMLPDERFSVARYFYENFNSQSNGYFGHYFRNLYRILKTIDSHSDSDEIKINYSRILRAQLSMDELTLIFINCLPGVCDDGKFANLIVKYEILEHLSISSLLTPSSPTDLTLREIDYLIGGKVKISINEAVLYTFPENAALKYHINSGAFGKNKGNAIHQIKEIVLSRKESFREIYPKIERRRL